LKYFYGEFTIGNDIGVPVGYREFFLDIGPRVSCFYALPKEDLKTAKTSSLPYLRYGIDSYDQLIKLYAELFSLVLGFRNYLGPLIDHFLRDLLKVKSPGFVINRDEHEQDKPGDTVVIFSHGACSGRFAFTTMHKYFAAQGITVYSIDHPGESCQYTETK
jgi:hypothetical protein